MEKLQQNNHNTTTLFDDHALTVATAMSGIVGGVDPMRMTGAQFKHLFETQELGESDIQKISLRNYVN